MPERTILIAVDAGERTLDAVRLGETLARLTGVPVTLASVFAHIPFETDDQRAAREEARRTLLELGATMEGVTVADARVVEARSPARALQRMTEEADAALIVIGSTTRGPVGRVVPGTVAERLLHGAACPVAIAPAGYAEREPAPLAAIGVAFDDSDESRVALEGAADLARRTGATLRIITAHQPLVAAALAAPGTISLEPLDEQLREERRAALDAAVAGVGDGVRAEGELHTGDAAVILAERSAHLDLLVAGSRGYGPLGAVLLGGTTHRLLAEEVSCPLVVVPRGRALRL